MPKKNEKLDYPSSRAHLATRQPKALHAALTCAGHTVAHLARICGVHHTTAGRWLYGSRPDRRHAQLIVKHYGCYGVTMLSLGYEDND